MTLQIYDPAFVETDDICEDAPQNTGSPSGTNVRNNMNSYANIDGSARYCWTADDDPPNRFCTGDMLNGSRGTRHVVRPARADGHLPARQRDADHGLHEAVQGLPPRPTPWASPAPGSGRPATTPPPTPTTTLELAKVFHQWVTFCTFTPTVKGDYYLQIRTNVAIPGSAVADGAGGYSGNPNVTSQTGDDASVQGDGNNRFALRATGAARGSVSISGWEHMAIFANSEPPRRRSTMCG